MDSATPSTSETIFAAALLLPENERLSLAARLLESVPDDSAGLALDDPDLLEQLKLRSADRAGSVPWSQLRNEF